MANTTSGLVGKVITDTGIESFIKIMAAKWDEERQPSPWWKFWKKVSFVAVTNFLLASLDDLIAYVDGIIFNSLDKKATVLDAMGRLYDTVVIAAMPIWLKPFAPMIRRIIIDEVVSTAIDWIVDKYRNGSWNKKDSEVVAAQWAVLEAQMFNK